MASAADQGVAVTDQPEKSHDLASTETAESVAVERSAGNSLFDDVESLIADGKTYAEAELHFQKTRAKFVSSQAKRIGVLAGLAFIAALLAFVALTVGLLVGLTPLLSIWGATAVVTGLWLIVLGLAGLGISKAAKRIGAAFESDDA